MTETGVIRCNNCGGALRVPVGVRFVTCEFCGSSLEVKHEGGVAFTAVVKRLDRLAKQVNILETQERLATLDRRWMADREELMVVGQNGERKVPSEGGVLIQGAVAVIFGVAWLVVTLKSHAPGFFPLFGLFFIGVALWGLKRQLEKAGDYARKKAAYERQRAVLQNEIEAARTTQRRQL